MAIPLDTTISHLPDLPAGFWTTFESRRISVNDLNLHAVIGGSGPPVLLVGGWPQTWFAWRHVMAALAKDFTVVAVDSRGVGLSDKPASGYDSATLANDLVHLMNELGHDRFALVGHHVGMWTSYALASDHPERVTRLAVAEATIPGMAASPPLLGPKPLNDFLWHFPFNRAGEIAVKLVEGREELYFGHQFASKSGSPEALSREVVQIYIDALKQPGALQASFAFYSAIDENMRQTADRRQKPLAMSVLALGGSRACNDRVAADMHIAATDVTSVIIPGCGHFMAEEAPGEMIAALQGFLRPYRETENDRVCRQATTHFYVAVTDCPPRENGCNAPFPDGSPGPTTVATDGTAAERP